MKEENLDNLFKSTLSSFNAEPSERVWRGIEAALDAPLATSTTKQIKYSYFAWGTVALLLLVSSISFFYLRSCNTSTASNNQSSKKHFISIQKSEIGTLKNTANYVSVQKKAIKIGSNNSTSSHSEDSKTENHGKAKSGLKSDNLVTNSIEEKTEFAFNTSPDNQNNSASTPIARTLNASEQQPAAMDGNPEVLSNSQEQENPIERTTELNTAENTLLINEKSLEAKAEEALAPSPKEIQGVHFATAWSFDAFVGPAFILSNKKSEFVFDSPMLTNSAYSTAAKSTDFGLNARFHVNNWFVSSGVGHNSYGENIDYNLNINVTDTFGSLHYSTQLRFVYDTIGYFDDPLFPGIRYPILSLSIFNDTIGSYWAKSDSSYYKTINVSTANKAQYIDIPLMFGYQLLKNNFIFEASTGISFGINVSQKGTYYLNNQEFSMSENQNPYRAVVLNYQLVLGFGYQINKNFSVLFRPSYRTNLNSVLIPSFGQDTRYHAFWATFGINYKFK